MDSTGHSPLLSLLTFGNMINPSKLGGGSEYSTSNSLQQISSLSLHKTASEHEAQCHLSPGGKVGVVS